MRFTVPWWGRTPPAAVRRAGLRIAMLCALSLSLGLDACNRGSPGSGPALSPKSYLLAPEQVHYGATAAEWSEIWWKWAMEHPLTNHPLFDQVGTFAGEWQSDPVWFLGGTFGTIFTPTTGVAERTITVPNGVALFFPIINCEWDNAYCLPPGWVTRSLTELRDLAYESVREYQDIYLELDGVRIIDSPDFAGASRFRAAADGFTADFPVDNIGNANCTDAVPGRISPIASDGIWAMIGPMPVGGHTLKFGGTHPQTANSAFFQEIITYHITVLP